MLADIFINLKSDTLAEQSHVVGNYKIIHNYSEALPFSNALLFLFESRPQPLKASD
jgi:hypothetical protein